MSKPLPNTPDPTPTPDPTAAALQGVAQALLERQLTPAEKLAKYKERAGLTRRFGGPVTLNGRPINARGLSDATINTVNALKSGTYLDIVTVTCDDSGIHIAWPHKTQTERMETAMRIGTFSAAMQAIAHELSGTPR